MGAWIFSGVKSGFMVERILFEYFNNSYVGEVFCIAEFHRGGVWDSSENVIKKKFGCKYNVS